MFFATFVLSTGRCGTQWLAEHLTAQYPDELCVRHEPLHNAYQPRAMLGALAPEQLASDRAAPILAHMDFIEQQLERQHYVECGHPCWSSIPYLAARFRGRVRVMHLVRHPVLTTFSWLTHNAYQPPLLPHLRENILLSPFDAGVHFVEYGERWHLLSPYEKCLYYWAEVNHFGLEQQGKLAVPWLRVTFEDLFSADGLERLLSFLDLPSKPDFFRAREQVIDQFHYLSMERPVLVPFSHHPKIESVASRLGFDLAESIDQSMRRRYFAS